MKKRNFTQHELVLLYLFHNRDILPAKRLAKRTIGGFFSSELGRRCREMREMGQLGSRMQGRYVVYYTLESGRDRQSELIKTLPPALYNTKR